MCSDVLLHRQINVLYNSTVALRADTNVLISKVGVLDTTAPVIVSNVTNLQSRVNTLESTSAVVVTNLTATSALLSLTNPRAINNTLRIEALETAGDVSVIRSVPVRCRCNRVRASRIQ